VRLLTFDAFSQIKERGSFYLAKVLPCGDKFTNYFLFSCYFGSKFKFFVVLTENLSNCDIELDQKILFYYKMVWYYINMRTEFGALKSICFEQKVSFKVLTKSGTNSSHFT